MKDLHRNLAAMLDKHFVLQRKYFLQQSQDYGLYVGQPQVLRFVRSHPGCSQNEIAEELGVSPASIAFSTKRLQNAGFLQKVVNSLNMRSNQLYVTPEGEEILDRFQDAFDKMNGEIFEGFSREDLEQFMACIEKINHNLESKLGEDPS